MTQYLKNIKELYKNFNELEVLQILRSKNIQADALSYLATSRFVELNQKILIEQLEKPSIEVLSIFQIDHKSSWIDPLMDYITKKLLSDDPIKARSIKRQASWYILQEYQ